MGPSGGAKLCARSVVESLYPALYARGITFRRWSSKAGEQSGMVLRRRPGADSPFHAGLRHHCWRSYLAAFRLADRSGLRLWMRHRLSEFLLAGAGGFGACGQSHAERLQTIQRRRGLPFSLPLRFDGPRRLCYIDCFSRKSLWALCGLIFARRGNCLRSRLRTLCGAGAWSVVEATSGVASSSKLSVSYQGTASVVP